MIPAPTAGHRPQIRVPFPGEERWEAHGLFERYALWPRAGASFHTQHWTAYYRWCGGEHFVGTPNVMPACCQIFVCQGEIVLPDGRGEARTVAAGDFACGMYSEAELAASRASPDLVMIVKYHADNIDTIDGKLHPSSQLLFIPYFYGHGEVNDFQAALLHGSPVGKPTNLAAIVRFPEGSVVSSHYHDTPIFHEMIYLQGGHLTPDGYYAPGDHITSIPGCKEGPWLATHAPGRNLIPFGWPRFVGDEALSPVEREPPWAPPFAQPHPGETHGLLFVHGGPFANLLGGLNWHVLGAGELGPAERVLR